MTACAELHTRAAGLQAAADPNSCRPSADPGCRPWLQIPAEDPSLTPTLPLPLASPRPYPYP